MTLEFKISSGYHVSETNKANFLVPKNMKNKFNFLRTFNCFHSKCRVFRFVVIVFGIHLLSWPHSCDLNVFVVH